MSTEVETGAGEDRIFVGYRPAAEYLGIARTTLNHYVHKGYGPEPEAERDQHTGRRIFLKSKLDHWKANRPGQGARTDRMHQAHLGMGCTPCGGPCRVDMSAVQ